MNRRIAAFSFQNAAGFCGRSPLTFRPNLAFKKGKRHGRQAAYDPSGGFLFRELDIRLLYRGDSPRGGEMSS